MSNCWKSLALAHLYDNIPKLILFQNDRLAYIQSHRRAGRLLDAFLLDHSLTATEIQKLSLGVVQAVCDLHRRNFVHGEITPLNIVVHEDCEVSLLVPDFSKPLVSTVKPV